MLRRKFLAASLGSVTAAVGPAHGGARLFTGAALAFGTTVTVALVHADERVAAAAIAEEAAARVGWSGVDAGATGVRLRKAGAAITLNGLAQGYAADLAMSAVRAHGIDNALLDTGEFAAHGCNRERQPWSLGVIDPRDDGALAAVLRIDGRCVATSGDYASTFTADFIDHHIFDPATGMSPRELASVTVLAPSALLADGLSTAFMVMGARKAHALAARLPGVDLMTINKRGVIWKSPAFPATAS